VICTPTLEHDLDNFIRGADDLADLDVVEAVADCLRRGASVGSVAGRGRGLASAGPGGALRVSLWGLIGESS
jgi:hypothetical protein